MASSSVHYEMILLVKKITTITHSVYDNSLKRNVDVEASSSKKDVFKVELVDSNLDRLLDRSTKHIALVQDEETES